MGIAPEPYLSACMEVLTHAALFCRVWGWSGKVSPEHLADLMDVIHNIPTLVRHWPDFDVNRLRTSLKWYEKKWLSQGGSALCQLFDTVVARTEATEGKRSMPLPIEVKREEEGRWLAEAPDLPGVASYGSTREEAIGSVQALYLRVLADGLEHGEAVPQVASIFVVTQR